MTQSIAVVESNPDHAPSVLDGVHRLGYAVHAARSGAELNEIMPNMRGLTALLLAEHLEDVDAIRLCAEWRNDPHTQHIAIILLCAPSASPDRIHQGLDAGALGFITLPTDSLTLRAWLCAATRAGAAGAASNAGAYAMDEQTLTQFAKLNHAVNNPLQTLYGGVDTIALDLPEDSPFHARLDSIRIQTKKVVDLVSDVSQKAKAILNGRPPGHV